MHVVESQYEAVVPRHLGRPAAHALAPETEIDHVKVYSPKPDTFGSHLVTIKMYILVHTHILSDICRCAWNRLDAAAWAGAAIWDIAHATARRYLSI